MDLFWFKKLVGMFLHPLPVLIGAALIGLILYFFGRGEPRAKKRDEKGWSRDSMDGTEKRRRRRRKWGIAGITVTWISLILLYLLGLGPVSKMFVRPLEEKYAIFDPESPDIVANPPEFIVVLGGSYNRTTGYPITSRMGKSSTARLIEGLRIHRALEGSRLVFTGGDQVEGEDQRSTSADGMAEMARMMGLDDSAFLVERDSRDTKDHPIKIQPLIGDDRRVIVVTSAVHLPRAMALFENAGYTPIPAPAGVTPSSPSWEFGDLLPSAGSYTRLDSAIHEYAGLAWAKIRGQIE